MISFFIAVCVFIDPIQIQVSLKRNSIVLKNAVDMANKGITSRRGKPETKRL